MTLYFVLSAELAALRVLWQRTIWLLNGQTHWSRPAAAGPIPVRIALRVLTFAFLPDAKFFYLGQDPWWGEICAVCIAGCEAAVWVDLLYFAANFYRVVVLLYCPPLALLCYFDHRAVKPCC